MIDEEKKLNAALKFQPYVDEANPSLLDHLMLMEFAFLDPCYVKPKGLKDALRAIVDPKLGRSMAVSDWQPVPHCPES